jgi:hypothetical protein
MHRNIDRITAEESIKTAMIGASVQSGEGLSLLMSDLRKQMGTVAEIDVAAEKLTEQLDKVGLQSLKSLASAFR